MANDVRIPKRIHVFGFDFDVAFRDDLLDEYNLLGVAKIRERKIYLQKSTPACTLTDDSIKKTFLHEVMHVILSLSGYDDLSDNEGFVEQIAMCLYQVFKTAEYGKKGRKNEQKL